MGETPAQVDLEALVRNARRAQNVGAQAEAYAYYSEVNDRDPQNLLGWIGRSETATDADEQLVSLAYALALDEKNQELANRLNQSLTARLKNAKRQDAARVFEVGREFARVGLRSAADEIFQRVTELDPTHVDAWLWRAVVAANLGEAQTSVEVARSLAPNDPNVRAAFDWLESGSFVPAATPAEETPVEEPEPNPVVVREAPGARLDPRVAEVGQALADADLLLTRGDREGALAGFRHATEIDPRSERAWLSRAGAAQDMDEALVSLEHVLELNPENVQAREARNSLRRQKLREAQPSPSPSAEPQQPPQQQQVQQRPQSHALRESFRLTEPAPTRSGNRLVFALSVAILLLVLAALVLWYLGFFKLV